MILTTDSETYVSSSLNHRGRASKVSLLDTSYTGPMSPHEGVLHPSKGRKHTQNNALCSTIVRRRNCSETFLPGGILQVHRASVVQTVRRGDPHPDAKLHPLSLDLHLVHLENADKNQPPVHQKARRQGVSTDTEIDSNRGTGLILRQPLFVGKSH